MLRERDAVDSLVGFARTLRSAGLEASPDRVHATVAALDVLDAARRADVYWAGRLTLCADHEEVERYDRAFAAYFSGALPPLRARRSPPKPVIRRVPVGEPSEEGGAADDREALTGGASSTEVLRHADIARLTAGERAELARLLAVLRLPGEPRRTRRAVAAQRGRVDRARTVRELLRSGGELDRLRHRRPAVQPRRVVLLVDVSGSMRGYADALLRFAHATAARRSLRAQAFTIGTRLTHVTRELSHRDPNVAMAALADAVPDYSGGTRLGEQLKAFCDRWGQRGTARGAVVVICSDGWERGDVGLLAEQMSRLSRLARRIVWANPRKGLPDYAPLAAGMAAALPYVDDFVAGHSLAALEHLARVVRGVQTGREAAHA
ncbi:MAG: VWA domain-containing protein [Solirubrobacterales bacterium]|nr:VWA domain-containing protein [Solirubrobacterales bacterium]